MNCQDSLLNDSLNETIRQNIEISCIEGMQKLPADSVELIVADSPCDASDIQIDFS